MVKVTSIIGKVVEKNGMVVPGLIHCRVAIESVFETGEAINSK